MTNEQELLIQQVDDMKISGEVMALSLSKVETLQRRLHGKQ